jgi:predicted TIM-barrel fold metal-dependent hydrolase
MLQGQAHARLDYNIVDSDSHVTEPPHLWQSRVPQKLKERAPKVVKLPNGGDAWSYEDGKHVRPMFVTTNAGGLMATDVNSEAVVTYDTIRPSHFDSKARVEDMDLDGIGAEVIYPLGAGAFGDDRELNLACIRAYNDWLVEEFCGPSGNRIFGLAVVPNSGVEDAMAEVERCMKKGHTGINLGRWPNGSQMPSPEDDKFWAMAEDMNLPVCIHIGGGFTPAQSTFEGMGPDQVALGTMAKSGATTMPIIDSLLGQAIAERFPKIKILFTECNVGWIPCYLEQADDRWLHYRFITGKSHLKMAPSEQFRRNFWATFMCDHIGVELRHYIGVDRIMWSTDFPHGGNEWPNSRNQIDRLFRDVPDDERKLILHDNACNFYNLTGV